MKKYLTYALLLGIGGLIGYARHRMPSTEGMVVLAILIFVVAPIWFVYSAFGRRALNVFRRKKVPSRLEGEVWINDKLAFSGVLPEYWVWGFRINNLKPDNFWVREICPEGPHILIGITPHVLSRIFNSANAPSMTVDFNNGLFGQIDDYAGGAAVEYGAHTRPIVLLIVSIERNDGGTKFEFTGLTGFVTKDSVPIAQRQDVGALGKRAFRVWFVVPDTCPEQVFLETGMLKTFNSYIARHTANPAVQGALRDKAAQRP